MTDFEKIKRFFTDHTGRFVCYKIIEKAEKKDQLYLSDYVYENVINNPSVKDFFVLEYSSQAEKNLITIESLDSFVFKFYFIDYGDKIIIDDASRTFNCEVEAFEGNGVIAERWSEVDEYLTKNNLCRNKDYPYNIFTKTSLQTFVQDTITFTKVLQTLNNAQPFPPYILELDEAKETVDVLTRTWIKNQTLFDKNDARELALFDNHKGLCQNSFCSQNAYPPFGNKHRFIGVFFNSDGKVLICKNKKSGSSDFAINDFVLKDEWYSLQALQRAINNSFGFDFFFGEIAPALTTVLDKVITDFYIVKNYDVNVCQFAKNERFDFEWVEKSQLLKLIDSKVFGDYKSALIELLYDLKSSL